MEKKPNKRNKINIQRQQEQEERALDNENYGSSEEYPQSPIYNTPLVTPERLIFIIISGIILLLVVIIALRYFYKNNMNNDFDDSNPSSVSRAVDDVSNDSSNLFVATDGFVYEAMNAVSCWGDEYTVGSDTETSFPANLAQLMLQDVYNIAAPNEDLTAVAARQGGMPMLVQPFVIPENTQMVEISLKSMDGKDLKLNFEKNAGLNPCIINGIEGKITLDEQTGKTMFSRSAAGTMSEVKRPTIVQTKAMIDKRKDKTIVFIGKSDTSDIERTISIYENMIEYTQPYKKSFIIVGSITGTAEENAELEKRMTEVFGRSYINMREYLCSYGLDDAGIIPSESDILKTKQGVVPNGLFNHDGSLIVEANKIIAEQVYARMQELGWTN